MNNVIRILAVAMVCLVVGFYCVSVYAAPPLEDKLQDGISYNEGKKSISENHKDSNQQQKPYYCMRSYNVNVSADNFAAWVEAGSLKQEIMALIAGPVDFYSASETKRNIGYQAINLGEMETFNSAVLAPEEHRNFVVRLYVLAPEAEPAPDYDADGWIEATVIIVNDCETSENQSSIPVDEIESEPPLASEDIVLPESILPESAASSEGADSFYVSSSVESSSASRHFSPEPIPQVENAASIASSAGHASSKPEASRSSSVLSKPQEDVSALFESGPVVLHAPREDVPAVENPFFSEEQQQGESWPETATTVVLYSTSGVVSLFFAASLIVDCRVLLWYYKKEKHENAKKGKEK